MATGYPRVYFLGIPVTDISPAAALAQVSDWIDHHSPNEPARHVVTANPEFIILALRNLRFRRILQRADLVVPDGIGLQRLAPLTGGTIHARVTGSDFLPLFAGQAALCSYRLFLLGAAPGIAEQAAARLTERFPGLQIAGTYAGSPAPEEEQYILERIHAARADLVAVAYGAPQQELWIARNRARCRAAVMIGVGGAFDYISGYRKRAPRIMREVGLEWLHRLITQPWRWRRMLALPVFVVLIVLQAIGRLVTGKSSRTARAVRQQGEAGSNE